MKDDEYSMWFFFSEKTRSRNSPSSLGSNVDGTIAYTPGGSLKRQLTSRKLMNEGERATDAVYLKKRLSSGVGTLSGDANYEHNS